MSAYGTSEVQDRFAAWLVSLDRDVSPESAEDALRELGSWTFTRFINDCKQIANRLGIALTLDGRIANHNEFTAVCDAEAGWRALGSSMLEAPLAEQSR